MSNTPFSESTQGPYAGADQPTMNDRLQGVPMAATSAIYALADWLHDVLTATCLWQRSRPKGSALQLLSRTRLCKLELS